MMNKLLKTVLYIGLLIALQAVKAQNIQFKVELLTDGVTYRVSLKPSVTWTSPNNNTLGAQVTLLAPTGSFQMTNLTSLNGTWSALPIIVAPSENRTKDYFVVYLASSANLPYTANVETPLFTFKRGGACAGTIELIDNNTDPFMPPNSQSLNVGNYVTTRGGGGSSTNLWSANYGGAADCRTCSVEYKLTPLSIGKYQVSMIPKATWSGVLATTATQQITIRVPTGGFQASNLTNLVSGVTYGQTSRFDAPSENTTKDYLVFSLQTLGTRNISYVANTEVPLFTFENDGICGTGNVELMDNTNDPFRVPNSRSANVGQQLTTIGGGVDVPICLNTNYSAACGAICPIATITGVVPTQPNSCTTANGSITINATSTSPLEYSINNGATWQTNNTFNNLGQNNYNIKIRIQGQNCETVFSNNPIVFVNPTCPSYTIQGRVFKTCNTNGVRDTQAQIMPNITVILRGVSNNPLRSITTDAQGFYRFDTVPQGNYSLKMSLPAGYAFAKQNGGTDRNIDSDVDSTGVLNFSTSNNSSTTLTFDAGYRDIEAPVITPIHPLLVNQRNGDTLRFSCLNPTIFRIGDVTAKDNSDTVVVENPTGNGSFGRPVTRIQFIDSVQKIGNCARDGYTFLLECDWHATDNCGNRSIFKVFIKIIDDQAPILRGVPANITVNSEANVPTPAPVTASDNCTTGIIPVLNQTQQNTTQPCEYLLTRTWTATDDCGNSTTASQQILVRKDSTCNARLCAPSALSQDSVVITDACGTQPKACINLPKNILENYNIAINNLPYTAILEGCNFDTAISYSYFSFSNRGAQAPFNLDAWIINGQSYSARNIPSIQALVDTMNHIDPNGRWVLDLLNYCITRTNYYQVPNFGTVRISFGSSGSYAVLQANRSNMPYGTSLNIQRGRSVISLVNKTTGCTDSVVVYARCLTNDRSTGYKNDWESTWQKGTLPDQTCFYQLDIGKNTSYTGYLQLKR